MRIKTTATVISTTIWIIVALEQMCVTKVDNNRQLKNDENVIIKSEYCERRMINKLCSK